MSRHWSEDRLTKPPASPDVAGPQKPDALAGGNTDAEGSVVNEETGNFKKPVEQGSYWYRGWIRYKGEFLSDHYVPTWEPTEVFWNDQTKRLNARTESGFANALEEFLGEWRKTLPVSSHEQSPTQPVLPSPNPAPAQEQRDALAYYWDAIDAIYNDGEEGRRLVKEHFGLWHPPYQRKNEDELAAQEQTPAETPRTDKEAFTVEHRGINNRFTTEEVSARFARELERELAESQKQIEEMCEYETQLRAKLAESQKREVLGSVGSSGYGGPR